MKTTGIGSVLSLNIYASNEKSPYPQAVRHLGQIAHPVYGLFDIAFTNEERPKIVITHSATKRHAYLHIDGALEEAAMAMMVRANG